MPNGSTDVVLTFRNVHNWRVGYQSADKQDYSVEAFKHIFAMLKPGGILAWSTTACPRAPMPRGRRVAAIQGVDGQEAHRRCRFRPDRQIADQRQCEGV